MDNLNSILRLARLGLPTDVAAQVMNVMSPDEIASMSDEEIKEVIQESGEEINLAEVEGWDEIQDAARVSLELLGRDPFTDDIVLQFVGLAAAGDPTALGFFNDLLSSNGVDDPGQVLRDMQHIIEQARNA